MTSKRDDEQQKPTTDKEKAARPKLKKDKLRDLSHHGGGEQPRGGARGEGEATYIGTQWNCCG